MLGTRWRQEDCEERRGGTVGVVRISIPEFVCDRVRR